MSITFKQTIIHTLDLQMGTPIISKEPLVLDDRTESFITRSIIKVVEDQGTCEAAFKGQQVGLYPEDEPCNIVKEWKDNNFKHLSEILANKFFSYMTEYGTIASGDLIVTNYIMDGNMYVAVLKINFKDGVNAHWYDADNDTTRVIENKATYESKCIEAAIINLENEEIKLLDGTKSKYISLLLDVDTKMSVKEKLKAIDKVAAKVIEEHYENPIKALNDLKANISESLARTNSINVAEVVEQTFGGDEEVLECCKDYLEEFGLNEEQPIQVTGSKLFSKYSNQKLKTDTGIEIKMPTHLCKDNDFFEMVNEPNGTITLKIKNVSQVLNK